MAAGRRRTASDGSDEEEEEIFQQQQQGQNNSPASSDEEQVGRGKTSIRSSRRATTSSSSGRKSAIRARRPTPIVKNRRSTSGRRGNETAANNDAQDREGEVEEEQAIESYSDDEETQDQQGNAEGKAHTKYSTSKRKNQDGSITIKRSRRVSRRTIAHNRDNNEEARLSWYERILPNFMLNMTAPLTGYENEVPASDVEDEEHAEILDRSRIKRNRRIRRRLVTFMLLAAAASLIMYTRGRLLKKVGVRAAVSSMKQRIEEGFGKTVQETMGK